MSNVISDHADEVLVLLRTDVLADIVHDGKVPDGAQPPYVLVYLNALRPKGAEGNSLDGLSGQLDFRITCHCAGADATAARAMASQVSDRLLDAVPTITDRTCRPITHESSADPASDETTGVQVMDQIDVYRLTTTPAV